MQQSHHVFDGLVMFTIVLISIAGGNISFAGSVTAQDATPTSASPSSSTLWLPAVVNDPTATATPTPLPTATPLPPTPTPTPAAACTITRPVSGATVSTSSNCVTSIAGSVQHTPRGAYLRFSVYTNTWYVQTPRVNAPSPSGTWQASPIYLAGQGIYNSHTIQAQVYNSGGVMIASCQVSGVSRSNSCATP